jgi:hypothetical protein
MEMIDFDYLNNETSMDVDIPSNDNSSTKVDAPIKMDVEMKEDTSPKSNVSNQTPAPEFDASRVGSDC